MGWKDAPLVQAKAAGKWKDAPLVEAASSPAATSGDLPPEIMAAFESGKLDRRPIGEQIGDFSNAVTTAATEGMTLGFADELGAGIETPFRVVGDLATGRGFDPGRAFNEGLTGQRDYIKEQRDKNPTAAAFGDLVGSVATGGALAKGGMTLLNGAKSVPGLVVRGAAEGAAYGGVGGFGRSEAEDVGGRLADAGAGALTGAMTGGAMTGVLGALAARSAKGKVPTVDELKDQARALYDAAEASGVTFAKTEVKQIADDIAAKALSEGIDPTLHPRATAALKRLMEAADTGMTVKNAQTMRRVIAAAGKDPMNPDEARIVGQMLEKFDGMVAAKSPELTTARGIYSQAKKGELIEQAIELAKVRAGQYGNGGMENALRTEFRALARKIVKGQLKGLSQAEIDAINKVAEGGPVENVLRFIGKAAPTGIVSAGLGSGVPFAIGSAVGGPGMGAAAAGATMGAGILGRSAAGAMTGANAVKAALLARSGGQVPRLQLPPAVLRALVGATSAESGALPQQIGTPRLPQMAY